MSGIASLIPDLQPFARALLDVASDAGLQPRITSARRTHAEQSRLYRNFVAGQHAYPVAPPGTSAHEYGWAFDMVISPYDLDYFRELGQVWRSWGGVWGGAMNDPIHFEYPGFNYRVALSTEPWSRKPVPALAEDFIKAWVPGASLVSDLVSWLGID